MDMPERPSGPVSATGPRARIDEIRLPRLGLHFRLLRAFEFGARLIASALTIPFLFTLIAQAATDGGPPVAIAVLASFFCAVVAIAYASWRNFGNVSLRRLRYYFATAPVLFFLTLAVVYRLQTHEERVQDSLTIILGLSALIALPSMIAIYFRRVRFAGLPRGRVRLKAISDPRRDPNQPHHRTYRSAKRRRWAAAYLAACIIFFIAFLAVIVLAAQWGEEHATYYQFTTGLLAAISAVFFVMFRRYSQPTADEALQGDRRTPLLYLRSFDDDFDSRWRPTNIIRFLFSPLNLIFDYSLEDRLARFFRHFGPLVAIGSPKEKMPVLGAARVLLDDAHWQAAVLRWMEAAKAIVVLAGHTEWLVWEILQIRERDLTQKVLFIFPPAGRRNANTRLDTVRRAFAGSRWEAALAGLDRPGSLRALILRGNGGVVVIRSRSRSRDMIHVATMVAHHLLQRRDEWEAAQTEDGRRKPGMSALRFSVGRRLADIGDAARQRCNGQPLDDDREDHHAIGRHQDGAAIVSGR